MATGTAKLTKPTKDQVELTTAKVEYSASGWELPKNESEPTTSATSGATVTWKTYKDIKYTWKFSPGDGSSSSASGTNTFSGLTRGAANTCTGTLLVTCTQTIHTKSAVVDVEEHEEETDEIIGYTQPQMDDDGKPIEGTSKPIYKKETVPATYKWGETKSTPATYEIGSTSDSVVVYTKPGQFYWKETSNFEVNDIIGRELTITRITNWSVHCAKFRSWNAQSNMYSNNYTGGATASGIITATWYNTLAEAALLSTRVTGGPTGTIITASIINQLATAICKS